MSTCIVISGHPSAACHTASAPESCPPQVGRLVRPEPRQSRLPGLTRRHHAAAHPGSQGLLRGEPIYPFVVNLLPYFGALSKEHGKYRSTVRFRSANQASDRT